MAQTTHNGVDDATAVGDGPVDHGPVAAGHVPAAQADEAVDGLDGQALMAQLSGVVRTMDELEAYLERLVQGVKRHIEGCDEVGVTLMGAEHPRTAAYTTALTLEIDAVQYAVGDGPCLDAYRNRRENHVDMRTAHERWPAFVERVEFDGVRSLMALPLVSNGRAFGALNLYGFAPAAFDGSNVPLVRRAAQRAADAIGAAIEIIGARELAAQMEQAMGSRAVIEQAKGVLMGLHGLDETAAFDVLRQESQRRNIKVRDLSTSIVSKARHGDLSRGTPTLD